jgi:hypothetical protein
MQQWVTTWNIAAYPADQTCISMTPDVSGTWQDEDNLMEPRVMGQFIILRACHYFSDLARP